MKIQRTPYEAVLVAAVPELQHIRRRLLRAVRGDLVKPAALAGSPAVEIRVVGGRGFWARWAPTGDLHIDVGTGGIENFAEAFNFVDSFPSGVHNHFDPPAFDEEPNNDSVPLVVTIE